MPNLLAHFGAQAVLTRTVLPKADIKVIFLGCLLPDVPWILQRIIRSFFPGLDPYSVRLYAIVQASLFVTLFLCGALALLSKSPGKVFSILAINSLLHLTLDALQTKWANGVHLFAPFSWALLNFELFWPESLPTYVLTLLGLGYIGWVWRSVINESPLIPELSSQKIILAIGLVGLYVALPFGFLNGPFIENNHYIQTLQTKNERMGHEIEFDRRSYTKNPHKDILKSWTNEEFQVIGKGLDHSSTISIRGHFVDPHRIKITEVHEHVWWFREGSSYIALVLLLSMWGLAFFRTWKSPNGVSYSK